MFIEKVIIHIIKEIKEIFNNKFNIFIRKGEKSQPCKYVGYQLSKLFNKWKIFIYSIFIWEQIYQFISLMFSIFKYL